jgi:aryl-alcohol dehydrogenase-like predicted oxidoreductase
MWLKEKHNEANLARVREFCHLARRHSYEPNQVALAWLLRRPEVSSVITGATDVEQVQSNLKALDVQLPDDVWGTIESLFPRGL